MFVVPLPTPARLAGLTFPLFGLVSCIFAWARSRGTPHPSRLAAFLAVLQAALVLDTLFNGRWHLHNLLAHMAMARNLYGGRSGPQHVALDLLAAAIAACVGITLWLLRSRPGACIAACGGILSLCCWSVEVISLHGVDSLLYSRVDGVMLVRLLYTACSLMTGAGILWDMSAISARAASRKSSSEAAPASLTPSA